MVSSGNLDLAPSALAFGLGLLVAAYGFSYIITLVLFGVGRALGVIERKIGVTQDEDD